MVDDKRFLFITTCVGLASLVALSGCSTAERPSTQGAPHATNMASTSSLTPSPLTGFDASRDWVQPDASPYPTGLTTVTTPRVPKAFEQTGWSPQGVASIRVSGASGAQGSVVPGKDWTSEIVYKTNVLSIDGETYIVPAQYAGKHILLLPIDGGIVWAPVDPPPGDMAHPEQALLGETDIFYTPYQPHGGSLGTNVSTIARLPHRWMGLDGPVAASAWTGWLPANEIAMPHVVSDTTYHMQFDVNTLKSATPVSGGVAEWPTLHVRNLARSPYYAKPHYAAFIGSLTRTHGGFVLQVGFMDATQSGRNTGMADAAYYWSESAGKWTPLNQTFTVQTLAAWTVVGSDAVYWMQPSPIGDGSGSELDATEMYFDPATLTMKSVWLGNWVFGPSFVDGKSWVVVWPDDMPTSATATPKKWTVYTP